MAYAPSTAMETQPPFSALKGVRFATAPAGIKYQDRDDVLLVLMDENTTVAGVFTQSKCPSAPVDWCKAHLAQAKARALIVNSGNANAFTGKLGKASVEAITGFLAQTLNFPKEQVFVASTGVIGEPLDAQKIVKAIPALIVNAAPIDFERAAKAIMTTDTRHKTAHASFALDGESFTISAMAKGAGMIAPDMATMLAFLFTDVPMSQDVMQACLSKSAKTTFNSITIDGDTSTSDTVLLFSTNRNAIAPITSLKDRRVKIFQAQLEAIMRDLAHQIVKDGEGARKFVEVRVTGAVSAKSAKTIAFSIANSLLVKTAIAGEDANWGRIVMAVGKSGEPADRDLLSIAFGDHLLARHGLRVPDYDEASVSRYMRTPAITIRVDIGLGSGKATVWTCDLTKSYVEINGDYRS